TSGSSSLRADGKACSPCNQALPVFNNSPLPGLAPFGDFERPSRGPNPMFIPLLAQATSAPATNPLTSFVPLILIFVIMYFVLFRPQIKRQKEQAAMASTLKTGDRVVTASGIHGMISNVKERTVIVKVADNVKLEMEKSAITTVVKAEAA
ncbi:MAG: preprotein translocase subunit YajC, partial [Verrucomicrobiota bacterium]|nr:preprotein translocase subunit YajC [Verrucomicrobiota bacterium]